MSRTASDYIGAMKDAIGLTRSDAWHLLNDAGRDIFAIHDWWWRHRDGTLSLTAGQDYIDLPETWGGLEAASMVSGSAYSGIQLCSLADIMAMRNGGGVGAAGGTLFAYFGAAEGQIVVEDVPRGRALLGAAPAVSEAGAISVVFLGIWKEIDEDDDYAVPNIPPSHEKLLECLCRAHAVALQEQSDPHEDTGVKKQLAILLNEDGRRQRTVGRVQGGAGRFMRGRGPIDQRNFGSVTV